MGVSKVDTLATGVFVGIVANPGGGQANATLLGGQFSNPGAGPASLTTGSPSTTGQAGAFRVDTVATAADSVKLPASNNSSFAVPVGTEIWVTNAGAASMQVFGSGADTINAAATGTGVAQAAGLTAIYKLLSVSAAGVGDWRRNLSA